LQFDDAMLTAVGFVFMWTDCACNHN